MQASVGHWSLGLPFPPDLTRRGNLSALRDREDQRSPRFAGVKSYESTAWQPAQKKLIISLCLGFFVRRNSSFFSDDEIAWPLSVLFRCRD